MCQAAGRASTRPMLLPRRNSVWASLPIRHSRLVLVANAFVDGVSAYILAAKLSLNAWAPQFLASALPWAVRKLMLHSAFDHRGTVQSDC
eukprot:353620-Chlamydomonas_euryale.AAC.3